MYLMTAPRRQCVARERAASYGVAEPAVSAALAKIREGLDELARATTGECSDDDLAAAVLEAGAAVSQLTAQETRLVGAMDDRDAF